jgi:glycerophosphoryl diester phosphodiesterase
MASRAAVAAHRGGALLWPENSLLAFHESLELGVDLLELDVHRAADGAVVVIHDPLLDRTTDQEGAVGARTAADLRRARLRGPDGAVTGERVPLLDEVLALVAPTQAGLLLEVKGPEPGVAVRYEREGGRVRAVPGARYDGLEQAVVAALERAGLVERTTLLAFSPEVLARAQALRPGLRTSLLVAEAHVRLVDARPDETIAWALAARATDAGLQHTLVDATVAAAARAAGLVLGVWTVNDEAALARLVALGVDVLTSDRPDLALRVVRGT